MHDAGSHLPDARVGSLPDSSSAVPSDAGGAPPDAGDAGQPACDREPMPLWPSVEDNQQFAMATRVPLAILCPSTNCPVSLTAISRDLRCTEIESDAGPDEPDAGSCPQDGWIRREGCGSVQFDSPRCNWPRHYNFDANTGELIGAARFDDIFAPLQGTLCEDAGYVAGTLMTLCRDETVSRCVYAR